MVLEHLADRWEVAAYSMKCDWHNGIIIPGEAYLNALIRVQNNPEPDYVVLTLCEACALMGPPVESVIS